MSTSWVTEVKYQMNEGESTKHIAPNLGHRLTFVKPITHDCMKKTTHQRIGFKGNMALIRLSLS